MKNDLTRAQLEDMHSVLRRSLERAERRRREQQDTKADYEADQLARAVADLAEELAGY